MNEPRKYGKSRIAITRGSTLQNKQNGPNKENKRVYSKKVRKSPHERKTLSSKNSDNVQENPGVKLKRAKTAPDFSKLHMQWEAKLAKGKAVAKRPNTTIEPFALTNEISEKPEDINEQPEDISSEEDLLTTAVPEAIISINEENQIAEEIPPACCSCGKPKQVKSPEQEFKVPKSIRKTNLSSAKKKKKVEFEEDLLEFKTDSRALQSILNSDGIISTTPSRKTFGVWRSPLNQKRTSIYYTGPRRDRSPGAFEKRLSIRRAAALMAKKQAESPFQPWRTLVGVQEIGSKFNMTTTGTTPYEQSSNDFLAHAKCIPEETEKTPESISSDQAVANEVSWADTLKYYSQSQQEIFSPINNENQEEQNESKEEDQEALLAQLEEEVRQTLANAALEETAKPPKQQYPVLSSSWSKTEFTECLNVSIPLQQRREKPSIYRKLFASPFSLASNTTINSGCPKTSALLEERNVSCGSSDMTERAYETTPTSLRRAGLEGLVRSRNERPVYLSSEPEYPSERLSQPTGETWIPFLNKYSEGNLLHNRGINGGDLLQKCNATSKLATPKITSVTGISGQSFLTGASIGGRLTEAAIKETSKRGGDLSLLAAASASLNSKLRKKASQMKSAFQEIQPPSVKLATRSHATNIRTPVGTQNILVPTPVHPFASDDDVLLQNSSAYIFRPREIIREAKVRGQGHTQQILLDAEVSQYTWGIGSSRNDDCHLRLMNPVAKLFNEGDERHFVPVLDDEML